MLGYHFTGDELRDGREIPEIGEWLHHEGAIVACSSGLHASRHPFDALQYAPGLYLHKVELRGEIKSHGLPIDKYVGRSRRIIASIDASEVLRSFARREALSVAHLWEPPEIVIEYLFTGEESIRDAARGAARGAAWDAARGAAWDAAWGAAWGAAWDAARGAAWDAAWGAAWDAARGAAWDAAWDAARGAAWDAAWDAARARQRKDFAKFVKEAFAE